MKGSDSEQQTPKFVIIDSQARSLSENPDGAKGRKGLGKPVSRDSLPERPEYNVDFLNRNKIIHSGMQDLEVLNAFRSVRMSLQSKMEKYNSVILVSAVSESEYSAFTAANLASAFTFERGKSALLIDCDIKRPFLAKMLGVDVGVSLYDYLSGENECIENLVHPTMIPRLSMVSNNAQGDKTDDIVEIFSGDRMKKLIEDLRRNHADRVIILSSPPILDSADTKVLASLSDYVIVALPYGNATPTKVTKTIAEFGKDKITGFVMIN